MPNSVSNLARRGRYRIAAVLIGGGALAVSFDCEARRMTREATHSITSSCSQPTERDQVSVISINETWGERVRTCEVPVIN